MNTSCSTTGSLVPWIVLSVIGLCAVLLATWGKDMHYQRGFSAGHVACQSAYNYAIPTHGYDPPPSR